MDIDLNTYQQVFLVFYAILYCGMLQSVGYFGPFPWGQHKKLYRALLSLVVLNGLPFFYFLIFLCLLAFPLQNPLDEDGPVLFGVKLFGSMLCGLSVFGPQRLYVAIAAYFIDPWIEPGPKRQKMYYPRIFDDKMTT